MKQLTGTPLIHIYWKEMKGKTSIIDSKTDNYYLLLFRNEYFSLIKYNKS